MSAAEDTEENVYYSEDGENGDEDNDDNLICLLANSVNALFLGSYYGDISILAFRGRHCANEWCSRGFRLLLK